MTTATKPTEILRREWRRIFPTDCIALANSNEPPVPGAIALTFGCPIPVDFGKPAKIENSNPPTSPMKTAALTNNSEDNNATTLTSRAHRASAEAVTSGDPDAHFDAAVLHRQAQQASQSARDKVTSDMHTKMVEYHRGKAGASERALENALSLTNNPFLPKQRADSTASFQQQFQRTPDFPRAESTGDRTIGASDEQIDQLAANPDDTSPTEALNIVNRLVQRKIAADGSSATDTAKHLKYWSEITGGNPALFSRACSQFKPSQAASIPDADDTDEKVTAALYNDKFNELLPSCNGDPVRTHAKLRLLHPNLIPQHRA